MTQPTVPDHRDTTPPDLHDAIADICQRHGIAALYAFGSRGKAVAARVRGQRTPEAETESDLDVGVLPARRTELSVTTLIRLARELEDLLSVARVDLVVLSQADPFLAANIVRGERLYARNPHAADEYELYVLRRAGDLAPLERERMALILGEEQ